MGGTDSNRTGNAVVSGEPPIAKPLGDGELSRDKIFQTLSNRRRRLTLQYLSQNRGTVVRLRDLSEWIAAAENGIPSSEVTYKQRKRVYTSLYQSHLPVLKRDGIVEYNKARGTVSLTDAHSLFETYLEPEDNPVIFWETYWLGLGLIVALVAVAFWVGLLSQSPATATALLALTAVTVLVSALVYRYRDGELFRPLRK
ncbi:hypothetical protein OB919_16800 [Halobacteria archaeon AArc-curdl1]|uniref:DUF7344 domain-containing protein n=1 Tax=Natronosalvus hydrolyticus TaxID=2979988 RepID=A0AAP3E872_9EURY|nr:hypothetical protein [Halobacteria archaeon AArc-curdl1]